MDPDQFAQLLAALQPGPLDWMAGLGVPLFIGGVTLWVAIWAVKISKDATRQTKETEEARLAREGELRRRQDYTTLSRLALFEVVFGADENPATELRKLHDQLLESERYSGEASLGTLRRWITGTVKEWRESVDEPRRLAGEVLLDVDDQIEQWAKDPATVSERVRGDARRIALLNAYRKMKGDSLEGIDLGTFPPSATTSG